VELSLPAPEFTLVPRDFFNPDDCVRALAEVSDVKGARDVRYVKIPEYDAYLIYSVSGEDDSLPEMFHILRRLPLCREYNKILCSWKDGYLHLAIAQGKSLLLANVFKAADFTTAQYYIFLALKSLQLNPEVSTICIMDAVGKDLELGLYRYFKAVEVLCG